MTVTSLHLSSFPRTHQAHVVDNTLADTHKGKGGYLKADRNDDERYLAPGGRVSRPPRRQDGPQRQGGVQENWVRSLVRAERWKTC